MEIQRRKPKVWLFVLLGALALLLFAVQPLLSQGDAGFAATPTPGAEGTPGVVGTPEATAASTAAGPQGFSSGDIAGMLARLGVVIVIIFVSLYLLRIWTNRTRGGAATGNVVRVLDTIALGHNRQMYVVDAGEKVLVVGATQQSLSLLSELSSPETLSAIRTPKVAAAGPGAAAASITDLVKRTTARLGGGQQSTVDSQQSRVSGQEDAAMAETLQRMVRGEERG